MRAHRATISGKWKPDSTGKSESEIYSPQVWIVYVFCGIQASNCLHHNDEAWWDLVTVAPLMIRVRVWYRPMSWFGHHTPATTCRIQHVTCHTMLTIHHLPYASRCLAPATDASRFLALWWENLFLPTTTATQLSREPSYGMWTEIQGWWRSTVRWGLSEIHG